MSRRDLEFLLFEWLGTERLLERERYAQHDRDTVVALLDLAERIATERFAPHNRAADLQQELEALFNAQNKSPQKDATSIPATFLRVTVTV